MTKKFTLSSDPPSKPTGVAEACANAHATSSSQAGTDEPIESNIDAAAMEGPVRLHSYVDPTDLDPGGNDVPVVDPGKFSLQLLKSCSEGYTVTFHPVDKKAMSDGDAKVLRMTVRHMDRPNFSRDELLDMDDQDILHIALRRLCR